MEKSTVVLVDATQYGADPAVVRVIERRFPLVVVSKQDDLGAVYQRQPPESRVITCFDFDFPDIGSLSMLSEAKREFTSVPMVMFTEQHSEALAVWALRTRVWDYFVKPLVEDTVAESLNRLDRLLTETSNRDPRTTIHQKHPLPDDARFQKHRGEDKVVETAAAYIDHHLADKLMQADIAERCGTNSYQLSRLFKRVYGITFQEYIVRRRIEKAIELLHNSSASVIDVCWAVGFHDASHFTKMFQRHTGMTPSQYRHKWLTARSVAAIPFQLSASSPVKI